MGWLKFNSVFYLALYIQNIILVSMNNQCKIYQEIFFFALSFQNLLYLKHIWIWVLHFHQKYLIYSFIESIKLTIENVNAHIQVIPDIFKSFLITELSTKKISFNIHVPINRTGLSFWNKINFEADWLEAEWKVVLPNKVVFSGNRLYIAFILKFKWKFN